MLCCIHITCDWQCRSQKKFTDKNVNYVFLSILLRYSQKNIFGPFGDSHAFIGETPFSRKKELKLKKKIANMKGLITFSEERKFFQCLASTNFKSPNFLPTRKHSSRMHAAHSLPYGDTPPDRTPPPLAQRPPWSSDRLWYMLGQRPLPPWIEWHTGVKTLPRPQTSFAGGKHYIEFAYVSFDIKILWNIVPAPV